MRPRLAFCSDKTIHLHAQLPDVKVHKIKRASHSIPCQESRGDVSGEEDGCLGSWFFYSLKAQLGSCM